MPVLVTPVARRTFEGGQARTTLTPYADAMKRVAKEQRVALWISTPAALTSTTSAETKPRPTSVRQPTTARTFRGAARMEIARLVAIGLAAAVPALRH